MSIKTLNPSETAEARRKRIAKLRMAIEAGSYLVSAEILSEKMIERMREGDASLASLDFQKSA